MFYDKTFVIKALSYAALRTTRGCSSNIVRDLSSSTKNVSRAIFLCIVFTENLKNGLFPKITKSVYSYFTLICENRNGLESSQTHLIHNYRNLKVYFTQRKLVRIWQKTASIILFLTDFLRSLRHFSPNGLQTKC